MAAYHRDVQLLPTLESIFNQQGSIRFEVIVVEDGYDGGKTKDVCNRFPVRYFCRTDRPPREFSNPAIPNNIGIRQARGEVLLLQNSEIKHVTPNVIRRLAEPVLAAPMESHFPTVVAWDESGEYYSYYINTTHIRRPLYFCQAVNRAVVEDMRGFDEDYVGYGYDDDDFANRLSAKGIQFVFHEEEDVLVHHQYHERYEPGDMDASMAKNAEIFKRKLSSEGPTRNLGREWGLLK